MKCQAFSNIWLIFLKRNKKMNACHNTSAIVGSKIIISKWPGIFCEVKVLEKNLG